MESLTKMQVLDRHALVMTVWLGCGTVAVTLFHYGLVRGSGPVILGAFAAILAAFVGHVIVNAVFRTGFSVRERALGLVVYAAALLAFGLAVLADPAFRVSAFLPVAGGFLALFAAVVFYMVTQFGVRGAFDAFDVIRSFRAGQDEAGPQVKRGPE